MWGMFCTQKINPLKFEKSRNNLSYSGSLLVTGKTDNQTRAKRTQETPMTIAAYYAPELAARSMTARAYQSLESSSKTILWYLDVERRGLTEVCDQLSLSPRDAVILAAQARRDLRFAWLEQQLDDPSTSQACKAVANELVAIRPRAMSRRYSLSTQDHLVVCFRCAILAEELSDLSSHLKHVVTRPSLSQVTN